MRCPLALSGSTTRLALLTVSARHIIPALGQWGAGGSLVVGLVVYSIIVVGQFIVIAKGA